MKAMISTKMIPAITVRGAVGPVIAVAGAIIARPKTNERMTRAAAIIPIIPNIIRKAHFEICHFRHNALPSASSLLVGVLYRQAEGTG